MRTSIEIRKNIANLEKKATELLNKDGVTKEELDNVQNEIDRELKALEIQDGIEAREREALGDRGGEARTPVPENLTPEQEYQNKLLDDGKEFQNYLLGKPNNMMQTGTSTSGGVAVGETLSSEIIRVVKERSQAYSFFNGRTGKGTWKIIVISGETDAEWVAEGKAPKGTADPTTSVITLTQHRLYKEGEITQQLINASSTEFVDTIKMIIADAIIDTLEKAIFMGDGSDQPTGITHGISAARTVTGAALGKITLDELKEMKYKLLSSFRTTASWFMATETLLEIDKLKDTQGRPLLQPDISSATGNMLLGLPVKETAGLDSLSKADGYSVVLASPQAYETNTQKAVRFMIYNDSTYQKKATVGYGSDIFVDGNRKNIQALMAYKNHTTT